jgi:acyl carrier protein
MLTEQGELAPAVLEAIDAQVHELLFDLDPERQIGSDDSLGDLGLNSLMLAQLLIALESQFGVDPFASAERSVADVRTIGDLVVAYDQAANAQAGT